MTMICIFCGKKTTELKDTTKLCYECNLAYEYAQITLEELRKVGLC